MGFTTGFTGGVTLALSVAYLTALSHKRNRQVQCDLIRTNAGALRAITISDPTAVARLTHQESLPIQPSCSDTLPLVVPFNDSNRDEHHRQTRTSFVDELKDRWNAGLMGSVRQVQQTDWQEWRETAEVSASHLWSRAFGGGVATAAGASVREAFSTASETVSAEAKDVKAAVLAKSSESWEKAQQKAHDLAAVTAGKVAENSGSNESAAGKTDDNRSEIESALQKRYAAGDGQVMNKSVKNLLEDRYKAKA